MVELSVLERLLLLSMLPEKGSLTTIRIVRQLRENLSFSEEENEALEFKNEMGPDDQVRTRWKDGAVGDKEFDFGPQALIFITDALKALSESDEVREEHLSLFDKFEIDE